MADTGDEQRALRRALASRLGELGAPLALIAEDVIGEEDGVIDFVAAEPGGRAVVILVATGIGDAALLQAGLVQCTWVENRIPDWRKLAPSIGLRGEVSARVLLVARDFARATRLAAREARTTVGLARWRVVPGGIELEALDAEPRLEREAAAAAPQGRASVFRSALRDTDFAN